MAQKIVIVESPAKAKTINKYLGSDYTVLASYGHIRDLLPKDGSVRPDEDFAMEWELGERADKPVSEISKAVKDAEAVYLASDPDREGEAIAWHILEVLHAKGLDKKAPIRRVTFNEITKSAVQKAIANPRDIDQDLVDAYMARRALDYLVGFSLSPVLWRKLPGAKSAGRVQSVALRLICERENEIEVFKPQEFWTIEGTFLTDKNAAIPAHLTHLDGKKLDKFALGSEAEAQAALGIINQLKWQVGAVEKKQTKRNPYPPFTTSTLQQEASRKLGLGATRTMRTAQQLYEGTDIGGETVGLITYMRTDGITLSAEAIASARDVIGEDYGKDYVPDAPRTYKNASKNAQEAHEAIRPTDMRRRPDQVSKYLDGDQLKLYTLIWQRTMASQMASAVLDQVAVDITGTNSKATFRATGSVVVFDGWLKIYQESFDDDKDASKDSDGYGNVRLPAVKEQDPLTKQEVKPEQHFTQPPPRYSEASLVKKLEELGIGRPSTYASIMQVLQDRDYVRLDKKRFIPEDMGRVVTAFLENYFNEYVQYDFTADLEEKLDDISGGRINWKKVLRDFWVNFNGSIGATKDLKISDVIDALNIALAPHFFPPKADGTDPRLCPVCKTGQMGLKLGKFGAFLGCSNYPTCRNTQPLAVAGSGDGTAPTMMAPRELGLDPETKLPISARIGPYGAYVQLGPAPSVEPPPVEELDTKGKKKKKKKSDAPKPKRVSLPKGIDPNLIDLDTALKVLSLPRDIGPHPETGTMIQAGVGRFGPYIKMGTQYKSLTPDDDALNVGINRSVVLLAEPSKGGRFGGAPREPAKPLGEHPEDGKPITLNKGRFGPYVKWGKIMATVTKSYDPENLSLKEALEIIEAKAAKAGTSGKVSKGKVKAKTEVVTEGKAEKAAKSKKKKA